VVACPHGNRDCRLELRLKRRGRILARTTLTVPHGDERSVALKLPRKTRRTLIRRRSMRVNAVVLAGGRTNRTSIRLLAPRNRTAGT
jgi:hypothetical protein